MGKYKTVQQRGHQCAQNGASPFPFLQDREDGDIVQDPIEEIVSGKDITFPCWHITQNAFQVQGN